MTLIASTDRTVPVTVPVTVQTRSTLGPEDAFRLNVPIDLSLVFTGWGSFPGVRGAARPRGPAQADGSPATIPRRETPGSGPHQRTGSWRDLIVGS